MNIILLTPEAAASGRLAPGEALNHLRDVVRVRVGGSFFVGVPDGLRGKAVVTALSDDGLAFTVAWESAVQPRLPVAVVIGLPRPQTARKVLHDLASMGVAHLAFFKSEKGDPAYATATLWRDGEAAEFVRKGVEQAFSTLHPVVTVHDALGPALTAASGAVPAGAALVAPDVYGAVGPLGPQFAGKPGAVLAIGPERGWSDRERTMLKQSGYVTAHLGDRVLRVETAAVASVAIACAGLGCWRAHGA